MRHLSRGVLRRLTTMLDYAQTHIFDAVSTCGRYQGRLSLMLIFHSVMHDITFTLPVGVNLPLGFNAKWPPNVNRRRAPGVLRLGFNGYGLSLEQPAAAIARHDTEICHGQWHYSVVMTNHIWRHQNIIAAMTRQCDCPSLYHNVFGSMWLAVITPQCDWLSLSTFT